MPAPDRRRRRALWGLVAYGVVAAVVLVSPVSPAAIIAAVGGFVRDDLGIAWFGQGWIEFVANILLFLPLGALLTVMWAKPWWSLLVAVALSVAAELVQLLLPARFPSLRDIVANAVGAAIGVLIGWLILRRSLHRPPTETMRAR